MNVIVNPFRSRGSLRARLGYLFRMYWPLSKRLSYEQKLVRCYKLVLAEHTLTDELRQMVISDIKDIIREQSRPRYPHRRTFLEEFPHLR